MLLSHPQSIMTGKSRRHRLRMVLVSSSIVPVVLCLSIPLLLTNADPRHTGRHPAQQRRLPPIGAGIGVHGLEPEYSPDFDLPSDGRRPARAAAAAAAIDASGNTRSLQSDGDDSSSMDPAAQLRADLLANYDRGSYPWDYAWSLSQTENASSNTQNVRTGLPIEVGINFHRVHAVSVKESTADIIAWFRLRWTDPRLTWDPLAYGNVTNTWFWIGDGIGSGETSEVWTPDLQLWNMDKGLEDSLSDAYASVSSDGLVYWSRPGHLMPACRFSGLNDFPFDTLSCTTEFGSWSYSGLYVRPVRMDGVGYSIGGSETAGQSYSEIQFPADAEGEDAPIRSREYAYPPFIGAPEEDWPVIFYDVKFVRSWQPYARGYILLQAILNFAGFAAFWLPVACGERMSLGITSLLAAVASELVVASSLPTASEMTWFQQFSIFSLVYAALALFESVAVIFFFYQMKENLKPRWYIYLGDRWSRRVRRDGDATGMSTPSRRSVKLDMEDSPQENSKDVLHVVEENGSSEDNGPSNARSGKEGTSFASLIEQKQEQHAANNSHKPTWSVESKPTLKAAPRYSSPLGRSMARDAEDFSDEAEIKQNIRWKKVSHTIDEVSRVVFPVTYIIILAVMLARVNYAS